MAGGAARGSGGGGMSYPTAGGGVIIGSTGGGIYYPNSSGGGIFPRAFEPIILVVQARGVGGEMTPWGVEESRGEEG